MATITVPQALSQNKDLIAVPRQTYDEFLRWQKTLKSMRTFKPSAKDKMAILRGRRNLAKGNYVTLEQLQHELAGDR